MCDNVTLHCVKESLLLEIYDSGSGITYLSRLKNCIVYVLQESEVPFWIFLGLEILTTSYIIIIKEQL